MQVLRADEVVGILVGAPKQVRGGAAGGEDETDDDLDPNDASRSVISPTKQKSGKIEACLGNGQEYVPVVVWQDHREF